MCYFIKKVSHSLGDGKRSFVYKLFHRASRRATHRTGKEGGHTSFEFVYVRMVLGGTKIEVYI